MTWTPIGDRGNAGDTAMMSDGRTGVGSVAYTYSIGTYEVTNAQGAEFLNAKAASDPFGLYDPDMGDPSTGLPRYEGGTAHYGGITRNGSYTYSVITGRGNLPVDSVSFIDAVRFTNWMNNGQSSGDTETGAYILLSGPSHPSNSYTVTRNPGASIALPTEDEWYKAAFYDALSASYFAYPASSSVPTICSGPTATANRANCAFAVVIVPEPGESLLMMIGLLGLAGLRRARA
jgi:formylglycine-generating enzyme required for sulfatase activity